MSKCKKAKKVSSHIRVHMHPVLVDTHKDLVTNKHQHEHTP